MSDILQAYSDIFSKLRTDKNRNRWTSQTKHQAPHKPFLLLSILDLVSEGVIENNFIEPDLQLVETFLGYWQKIMPVGSSGSMAYPFYHLSSSGFWRLAPNPGHQPITGRTVSSVKKLRENYCGAYIDEQLYLLLADPVSREFLRNTLLESYFDEWAKKRLLEQFYINLESARYMDRIIRFEPAEMVLDGWGAKRQDVQKQVRDQGFRKAIVKLYNHRCSLCGIRMLTPEGHTIVEAAHIEPWSKTQNDTPQNGLSLCRLCHWSFDEGLMSVGKDYEVLVSPAVRQDNNFPGHMETLSGRGIFKPDETLYWPGQDNLDYHRTEVFRKR